MGQLWGRIPTWGHLWGTTAHVGHFWGWVIHGGALMGQDRHWWHTYGVDAYGAEGGTYGAGRTIWWHLWGPTEALLRPITPTEHHRIPLSCPVPHRNPIEPHRIPIEPH